MAKNTLTDAQKKNIVSQYQAKESSQSDLAIEFGVSRTVIRTTLHEHKLVVYNSHATKQDRTLLETLQTFNITGVEKLREVLQRGLQC